MIVVPKPKQAGNCTNPIGDFACPAGKVPEAVRLKIPWRPHQRHWRGGSVCSACNVSSCYNYPFLKEGAFVLTLSVSLSQSNRLNCWLPILVKTSLALCIVGCHP